MKGRPKNADFQLVSGRLIYFQLACFKRQALGLGLNGQLGLGSIDSVTTLTMVSNDRWTDISCGFEFSVGLKSDGTIWTWGFGSFGQLGLGSTTDRNVPTMIEIGSDWQDVSVGLVYTFAIKKDGSLWGWGGNLTGTLGIGNSENQLTPVLIDSEPWVVIAGSDGYAVDGTVYGGSSIGIKKDQNNLCGTGYNSVRQLGNGTIQNRNYFDCDAVVSIEKTNHNLNLIDVYPNPTKDFLKIRLKKASYISLISITSKVVLQRRHFNEGLITLDVRDFSAGEYIMKISSKEGVSTNLIYID